MAHHEVSPTPGTGEEMQGMTGLSDILLSEGLITRQQLEEALEAQAVYGGNLDTCLLELGFLSEGDLEPLLGRAFGVPSSAKFPGTNGVAPWGARTPETGTLSLVTPTEASRWRVLPWAKDERFIDVITTGPLSREVQTELSRRAAVSVRPHVVTEARFALLLEEHCAIMCPPRFRTLLGSQNGEAGMETSGVPMRSLDGSTSAPTGPLHIEEKVRHVRDPAEEALEEFSITEAPSTALRTLDESLRQVTSRDQLPQAIFPFVLARAQRVALLLARPTLVLGWDAAGPGVDPMRIQTMCFPLRHPSMFEEAAQGDLFVGPVPFSPVNEEVIRRMGEPRMSRAVVAPIRLRGRLVVFLLADFANDRALEQGFSVVGDVAERASRALLRLAAERKRHGLGAR